MSPKLKQKLTALLRQYSLKRVNEQAASSRTQNVDSEVIFAAFRRLHALGYRLEDPDNFGEQHVRILAEDWWKNGFTPKTMSNNLSRLRVFFEKMGKNGMIKKGGVKTYLPNVDPKLLVVRSAATEAKSWASHEINIREFLERIDREDMRFGNLIRMQIAVGARREEALKMKPHLQDMGEWFEILPGQGKGGRPRQIPVFARQLIDEVKSRVGKNEALGWPTNRDGSPATLEQNINRYRNLATKLGITKNVLEVTCHGLRAQFAENVALEYGVLPPSLGGTASQLPPDELKLRLERISEAMGHHRPHIVAAYFGAFGRAKYVGDEVERTGRNIDRALEILNKRELVRVPASRFDECVRIRDLMTPLGCDLTLKQVHALWTIASEREGIAWKKLKGVIPIILEGAAMTICATSPAVQGGDE